MNSTPSEQANAGIAAAYDALPYDHPADDRLDPERVLGLAAVYGAAGGGDVLDLGCGAGAQLARAGLQTKGRLVGVDLSGTACARARTALQPFGARAEILQADLLSITEHFFGADQGQFDLIYNIGVIFVVPPDVRCHILELVAQCLKPGGVAVIGYYAGSLDGVRANLHRTLRAVTEDAAGPQAAVAQARDYLKYLQATLPQSPQRGLLEAALRETQNLPDLMLYHEALNQSFEAIQTSQLERTLAAQGVGFASYLAPVPFAGLKNSRQRAIAADTLDFCYGSYRQAVFVRWPDAQQSPDLRRANFWTSALTAASQDPDIRGPVVFHAPGNRSFTAHNPATAAMLLALKNGPLTWTAAFSSACQKMRALGLPIPPEELVIGEFMKSWCHELVIPRAAGCCG